MIYAPTYCPGSKCDPCKPPPVEHQVSVIGNSPYGPPETMFINWTWTAGSGIAYPINGTVLQADATITVIGYDAAGMEQKGSISMSGSTTFFGFPAIIYLPLPLTSLGITVVFDPPPQLFVTAVGDLIPEAGGVGVVFSQIR